MAQTIRFLSIAGLALAFASCAGPTESPGTTEPGGGAAPSAAAGRIGDRTITLDEVDAKAMTMNVQPYQALYDARKQALDTLVSDHLLEAEAAARGITREELVNQEVTQKVSQPSDEQIKAFFEQNKNAMRGRPLEEMSPQIRNYLATQSRQQLMRSMLADLRKKNAVELLIDAPRVPVTIAENDPVKGPADAPVQILEFSDFQ